MSLNEALTAAGLDPKIDDGGYRVTASEGRFGCSIALNVDDAQDAYETAVQALDTLPGCRVTISFTTQITVTSTDAFAQRNSVGD